MVAPTNPTVTNNTFIGNLNNFAASTYPQNTYVSTPPTSGLDYFVTPNKYEPGRAHIAIYNWANASTVQINASNIGLSPGDPYELVNAMDYFTDIITGTYNASGIITIPMTGHSAVKPIGNSTTTPLSPFPTFGAFVIRKAAAQTSSIYENTHEIQVSIFPNPFNEQCIIKLDKVKVKNYSVRICNLLGETVLIGVFENNQVVINKANLLGGIYLYTVLDENGVGLAKGRIAIY